MGSFRIFGWFGDETDPATNPPAAVASEASGAAAPTNGSQLRRRLRGFDAVTDETIHLYFELPANYSSGGTLTFKYSSNGTSGNVMWKTAWCLLHPSAEGTPTDFDAAAFGTVTVAAANATPTTAGVEKEVSIDLGVTGAHAGDRLAVMLGRDADNAADTLNAIDAELLEPWSLSGTTV